MRQPYRSLLGDDPEEDQAVQVVVANVVKGRVVLVEPCFAMLVFDRQFKLQYCEKTLQ